MDALSDVLSTLKRYRQAGLDEHGEFGPENLAYKALRSQGIVDKLYSHMDMLKDRQLSLDESGNQLKTVTRIDSRPIRDFNSNLKAYKHTDDWRQSGVDNGDDSYWKKNNLKTNTTKGLFAGDPHRTALYATGNAHETRYVEFMQDGQPIVYFDKKDLPKIRSRKTYLTVFDAANFKKLPTGEYFSNNPGQPLSQTEIGDPFQYITDHGWVIRFTDDLNKVFRKVKAMHKANKIPQYGAEGMNEAYDLSLDETMDEDYSVDNPPGPEFPPQFPAGTVKVDVSDVYDWYKLGQHISDLEGLGHHDFGQGPPSTILAFGTEEEEEKYIKNLKKLGLKIHDIDPPGLKGDVDEARLFEEFRQFTDEACEYIPSGAEKNVLRFKMFNESLTRFKHGVNQIIVDTPDYEQYHSDRTVKENYRQTVLRFIWENKDVICTNDFFKSILNYVWKSKILYESSDINDAKKIIAKFKSLNIQKLKKDSSVDIVTVSVNQATSVISINVVPNQHLEEYYVNSDKTITFKANDNLYVSSYDVASEKVKTLVTSPEQAEEAMTLIRLMCCSNGICKYNNWNIDIDGQNFATRFNNKLNEASGYIPSEAEKDDPRFSTALTVDVHPDSIQQNAKKLGSKIARSGVPPTLKPSGKI